MYRIKRIGKELTQSRGQLAPEPSSSICSASSEGHTLLLHSNMIRVSNDETTNVLGRVSSSSYKAISPIIRVSP